MLRGESAAETRLAQRQGWGSALGVRLATACVGLPLVGWILLGPSSRLVFALGILCALAGLEIANLAEASLRASTLADAGSAPSRWLRRAVVAASSVALFAAVFAGASGISLALLWTALVAVQAWIAVLRVRPLAAAVAVCAAGLAGAAYVGFPLALLARIRSELGPGWIVLAIAVTWFGDAGSYTAGRLFGAHKVAPSISPGKTLEGCVGGCLMAIALALVVRSLLLPELGVLACAAIGGSANVVGQGGDLFESCLKRVAGVKDSGQWFPGYGGVLDKVDSLLLAAPWIYACSLTLS
jgi:phosphatidate cytidylyltransferase